MMRAAKAEAGSIHISYTQNGQAVEEWISTTIDTLVSPTINSAAMMRGQMAYTESSFSLSSEGFFAARAPMGKFDKKLAATIIASTRPNPQYQEAVGNFLLSMAKIQQKGAMDRQKIWHDAQQHISATINESYRRQQAAQDRAAEQFDQTIRGVETYVNPVCSTPESRRMQTPLLDARLCAFGFQSIRNSRHEPSRVQQMLRPEMTLRPAAARLEFDSKEVADFAEHAILHHAHQLAIRIADAERRAQRDRPIHLQACARKRNVFEIRDAAARAAHLIPPLDVYEIRAEHPRFNSPIHHIYTFYRPAFAVRRGTRP